MDLKNFTIALTALFLVAGGCAIGSSSQQSTAGTEVRMVELEGGVGGPATRGDWDAAVASRQVQCGLDDVSHADIGEYRDDDVPRRGWSQPTSDEVNRCGDDFETLMYRLMNCEREARGIPPLQCDLRLVWAAREHSQDMYERRYFSHHTPEGVDPGQRLLDRGVEWSATAENIALSPTMALAHTGWMESGGHRANLLDDDFSHGGLGIVMTDEGYFLTALFARY